MGSDVETVRRWEDSGGTWQVVSRAHDRVVVSLRRCDGGEEADRMSSADPDLMEYLGGRESSDQ